MLNSQTINIPEYYFETDREDQWLRDVWIHADESTFRKTINVSFNSLRLREISLKFISCNM